MIEKNVLSQRSWHLLSSLQLLQGVDLNSIQSALQQCEEWHIATGDLLLSPAGSNNNVFGVLSGGLSVHLNSPDNLPLARVEVGACLGEISLIDGYTPSAYAVASEATHLLVMPSVVFWHLVDNVPLVNRNLLNILCQRLRHNRGVLIDKEKHANIDALTGLSNRRGLAYAFTRTREHCVKKNQPLSLIMADIDHFKRVNDRFGHLIGDRVLSLTAQLVQEHVRTIDKVARYGGEEFVVILPDTTLLEASGLAQRVRTAVGNAEINIDRQDTLITVTLSLGVAQMRPDEDLQALIHRADQALYQAKHQGRDRVCCDDDRVERVIADVEAS